ncbi:uncharacterized protein LOC126820829 [Patella vulgata]|uniref:uncharacterized protein LOC126820829 n=1 Tax=Patella vulgata TaxID=6465 RepID=UPI0021800E98|nr:uncharacterized protein LOC126820829 [Patella vulgata]
METYILVLDSFISILLFGPLASSFWRGTWGLADLYIFPENQLLSLCVSLVCGLLIYLTAIILQTQLTSLNKKMNSPVFYIVSRLYSYILGIAIINYWRGLWGLVDLSGFTLRSAGITTAISTIALVLCRGSSTSLGPPLFTITDIGRDEYFKITTIFKTKPGPSLRFYMDSCFSVVFVTGFAITQWRGLWTLIDLLLVPDDVFRSAWLSLVAGNILAIFLFVIQWPVMWLAGKIRRLPQTNVEFIALLGIEDLMTICGTLASVLVWRGCWYLYDQCLIVHDTELSFWVSHGIAMVIGMVTLHYPTLMLNGLFMDGEVINSGEKTFFDTKFISNFTQYSVDAYKKKLERTQRKPREINLEEEKLLVTDKLILHKDMNHDASLNDTNF